MSRRSREQISLTTTTLFGDSVKNDNDDDNDGYDSLFADTINNFNTTNTTMNCSSSSSSGNKKRLTESGNTMKEISFQEFRQATVKKYPNLSFLGPASMAVYFIKEWLRDDFYWIRYDNPCKLPKHGKRQKKPSYFYYIPGDYSINDHEKILQIGIPGTHYATSYIAIYNMVRQYGKFAQRQEDGEVLLVGYNSPPLPTITTTTTNK